MSSLEKCKANGGHERMPVSAKCDSIFVRVWHGAPDPLQCRAYARFIRGDELARESEITEALADACVDPSPENVKRAFA